MTRTHKDKPDHAHDIEDRLTKTLVRLRLAKIKQVLEQTGHPLEDIMNIQQREIGWRIGPAYSFPLHPREVEPLTLQIRTLRFRMTDPGVSHDDASTRRLCQEVAEYLSTDGYGGKSLMRRIACLSKRQLDAQQANDDAGNIESET